MKKVKYVDLFVQELLYIVPVQKKLVNIIHGKKQEQFKLVIKFQTWGFTIPPPLLSPSN